MPISLSVASTSRSPLTRKHHCRAPAFMYSVTCICGGEMACTKREIAHNIRCVPSGLGPVALACPITVRSVGARLDTVSQPKIPAPSRPSTHSPHHVEHDCSRHAVLERQIQGVQEGPVVLGALVTHDPAGAQEAAE